MKKIIGLTSIIAVLTLMSCSDKAETKKEVIVVTPVLTKDTEKKPATSITVDKNGVKVESKKVDVSVKKQ